MDTEENPSSEYAHSTSQAVPPPVYTPPPLGLGSLYTKISSKIRSSVTFKLFSMFFLLMISMIPVAFIQELVREREHLQQSASREVSGKWAGEQTVSGPILTLPYEKFVVKEVRVPGQNNQADTIKKETVRTVHNLHILPAQLKWKGTMDPQTLHRGIYDITVYNSQLQVQGLFESAQWEKLPVSDAQILWDQAYLSMGLDDLRGIEETVQLQWQNNKSNFDPGTVSQELYASGIHQQVELKRGQDYPFSFQLKLKGNQRLSFMPVGRETEVELTAPWPDPSFDGAFLPDAREITAQGFSARWKILHVNRNYPQIWEGKQYSLDNSAFGVYLIQAVDHYQKVTRSVKYALFFIGLTFLTFFFVEILTQRFVHPLQYLLVGFGLCVFYTLLLSISEHLGFQAGYMIGSVMTIGLITAYAAGFLRSLPLTAVTGGVLVSLFGFIYVIINQQDYALLMGSLGLFVVLALVMFFSNRLDLDAAPEPQT